MYNCKLIYIYILIYNYICIHRSSLFGQHCKPAAPKQHKHVDLYSRNSSLDHSSVARTSPTCFWFSQRFRHPLPGGPSEKSSKPHLLTWAISSNDIVISYLWSWVLLVGNAQRDTFSEIHWTGKIVDYCSTIYIMPFKEWRFNFNIEANVSMACQQVWDTFETRLRFGVEQCCPGLTQRGVAGSIARGDDVHWQDIRPI